MKRIHIIIISVIGLFFAGILLFVYMNSSKYPANTGGSGVTQPGYTVIKGYEVTSNDSSKIRLGSFLSSTQQKNIQLFLSALLFEKDPQAEYDASVTPGSVTVNYTTSLIQFKVEVKKPQIIYMITYNTLNDDMKVFDEKGQTLTPTINPDGTPFKSFRSTSRLAR